MRKLKTVKERVHQIKSDNDQLTTTDGEAAQVLGKFFSSVFLNERDGLVQEEDGWNVIINEDTVMSKLMGLKEDKSPGPDNIHSALLRNCARTVAIPLTIIYQKSFSEGILRNYQICRLLLLTDVIHYLDTSVAYRRTHLLRRHFNCQ